MNGFQIALTKKDDLYDDYKRARSVVFIIRRIWFVSIKSAILQQKGAVCRIMKRKYTPTENLKNYIAESLMLLMRKKGFADITIGEISARAGVNRSSYYRNFNSKEDIVKYYFNKIIFEHLETVKNMREIPLKCYLEKMFSHFYHCKNELLLIYKNKLSYLILDALNETFAKARKKQSFEDRFIIYYHTGGIYNTFLLWFADEMRESPEKMAELGCNLLPKDFRPMLL
jgi:AcrR family transcriptional regulator